LNQEELNKKTGAAMAVQVNNILIGCQTLNGILEGDDFDECLAAGNHLVNAAYHLNRICNGDKKKDNPPRN